MSAIGVGHTRISVRHTLISAGHARTSVRHTHSALVRLLLRQVERFACQFCGSGLVLARLRPSETSSLGGHTVGCVGHTVERVGHMEADGPGCWTQCRGWLGVVDPLWSCGAHYRVSWTWKRGHLVELDTEKGTGECVRHHVENVIHSFECATHTVDCVGHREAESRGCWTLLTVPHTLARALHTPARVPDTEKRVYTCVGYTIKCVRHTSKRFGHREGDATHS